MGKKATSDAAKLVLTDRATYLILAQLNAAIAPRDMGLPGLGLHPLKGDRKGTWAVKVSGNRRVTSTFAGKDADQVDYGDYY